MGKQLKRESSRFNFYKKLIFGHPEYDYQRVYASPNGGEFVIYSNNTIATVMITI